MFPLLLNLNESPPSSPPITPNQIEREGEAISARSNLERQRQEDNINDAESVQPLITEEGRQHRSRRLSNSERQQLIEIFLQNSENGNINHGVMKEAAAKFNISRQSLSTLWKRAKTDLANGENINFQSRIAGKVGRKGNNIDLSNLAEIPLRKRTNIRSLASALQCSKSSAHRLVQKGKIRPHSNALKPQLTEENKQKRLDHCLSKLSSSLDVLTHVYDGFYDVVHIDEKWFFITRIGQKYYLHPTEADPIRTCKSKRFITKVMFMAAIARPQFSDEGVCIFDGKIGIWPFIEIEPAKRKSKNRAAGVMVTKPIASITKDTIRASLVRQVIPAIKDKWPETAARRIYIQQDNAKPHINPNDTEFMEAATSDGFDIKLVCQPPNSPDLNCLDLGYFNAIQSLQHEKAPNDVNELVQAVMESYTEMDPRKLNYVWLSLQATMTEIIKDLGGNNFRLPHLGKERLERLGQLPTRLTVQSTLVESAIRHIEEGTINASQITEDATQTRIEGEDQIE